MKTSLRRSARAAAMAALLLLGIGPVPGQEEEAFDLFKPSLGLGLESSGARHFREDEDPFGTTPPLVDSGTDDLSWRSADLQLNIPLGGTRLHGSGKLAAHQFFAHAFSRGSRAEISFLPDGEIDLFAGGLGFTSLMLTRQRNLVAISAFATIAEEEETLGDAKVRASGMAVGSFRKGESLWFYGGGFTYHLGRPVPFPIFGGWGHVSPNWTLAGIVPFLFQAGYKRSAAWDLKLFLKAAGNQYRYENEGEFPGEDEDLRLRLVQGRAGASMGWKLSRDFTLIAEAGALFGRRLVFSDGSEEILEAAIEPGGYARLMVRLSFGESLFDDEVP